MFEGVTGLIDNFSAIFTLINMGILCVGVLGGLILGSLPGISPTLSVALLVPFTFHMDPAAGLILLGSVYIASVAGGAISAILINVPGAPANIATLLDGYPMTKAGRAQEALYTCFISSFVGGIFGVVVMVLLTTPLAEIALKFRSGEIFWVSVLGLTVVAGLASDNLARSLMGGALGVLLSTVGPNPTTGEFRFVFHDVLTGGIHIIVALIGLFAIPQVLSEIETLGSKKKSAVTHHEKGLMLKTVVNSLKFTRAQFVGSVVGSIVGLIPGVGGQVSGIVAYDQSKKVSKNPQAYGKGSPEGIVAAESANNAMVGPSLVPLLTLSIPGSPTAAVLLGGLLIHGISPGPNLFILHGNVVHTFIGSLLVAQFAMLFFGLVLARHSTWVTKVPSRYMAAGIIVMSVFGSYSISNNFDDLIIMFVVGVAMFYGSKFGMSATPVVMGLILGGITETSFLKGVLLANAGDGIGSYFFTGGIKTFLIVLCVLSLAFGFYSSIKGRSRKDHVSKKNLWLGMSVLIFFLMFYLVSLTEVNGITYLFPKSIILFIMAMASILILQEMYFSYRHGNLNSLMSLGALSSDYPYARFAAFFILLLTYVMSLQFIGFYVSSFVFFSIFTFLFTGEKLLNPRKFYINAICSLVFVACLMGIFNFVLKVSLPSGILF
jgi:putative tricarboxylic transport membrane protein